MMLETRDDAGLVAVKRLSKGCVYIYDDGARLYSHGRSPCSTNRKKKKTRAEVTP